MGAADETSKCPEGLQLKPGSQELFYALGNSVVIKDLNEERKPELLNGHADTISCLQISPSGKYLATGQETHMGFKTTVIIWDMEKREQHSSYNLHKVKVQALTFTADENHLISLGGDDDRSVIVWSLEKKDALCGSQSSQGVEGFACCLVTTHSTPEIFITAGSQTVRVWSLDIARQAISSTLVPSGHLRREVVCLKIDQEDEYFYCGTTSGDILKYRLRLQNNLDHAPSCSPIYICSLTKKIIPRMKNSEPFYSKGVSALWILPEGELLVGTGTGLLSRVQQLTAMAIPVSTAITKPKKLTNSIELYELQNVELDGRITSITVHTETQNVFVGTNHCCIYTVSLDNFKYQNISKCHSSAVNDLIFPFNCSELFITCAKEEIRVWASDNVTELLKIKVPRATCNAVYCSNNGSSIICGWDNGRITAYSPETGRELYTINDSHSKGVTSISGTHNSQWMISGGGDGQVRIWNASPSKQSLVAAMKEHKGPVSGIQVHSNDRECVTASTDGTCIIWDLKRFTRRQIIFANTLFQCVCYGPEECQIITAGTDRKIGYWEIFSGSLIRELEGSVSSTITTMDITSDANYFATAGNDKLVKVWSYQEGKLLYEGKGHGAAINKLKIAPNRQFIISVSSDGAILKWNMLDKIAT